MKSLTPQAKARVASGRPRLYVDGASRGNPGPAAAGGVVYLGSERLGQVSRRLGPMTNNQAEYRALLLGLELVLYLGFREVQVLSDSELMVRQLTGRYRVRNQSLKPLFDQAQALLKRFGVYDILHVTRDLNREADELANQALDRSP